MGGKLLLVTIVTVLSLSNSVHSKCCVVRDQHNEDECAEVVCEPEDVWNSILGHHHHIHIHHHHHHHHCSTLTKIKCAGKIAMCAAKCINTAGIACIACLGGSYNTCKSCF